MGNLTAALAVAARPSCSLSVSRLRTRPRTVAAHDGRGGHDMSEIPSPVLKQGREMAVTRCHAGQHLRDIRSRQATA